MINTYELLKFYLTRIIIKMLKFNIIIIYYYYGMTIYFKILLNYINCIIVPIVGTWNTFYLHNKRKLKWLYFML